MKQQPSLPADKAHTPIRVSMAALVRIASDDAFLLVRNLHRQEFFAPLGGVYKYTQGAIPLLADLGFAPEGYSVTEARSALINDLKRDLRGFLASENLSRFLLWFQSGKHRETTDCAIRELREELEQAGVPSAVIDAVQNLTFTLVRTIKEGPAPTPWGYDQLRWIDIYEPSLTDPIRGAGDREIIRSLFSAASRHSSLLVVAGRDIERLRAETGQPLAGTVDYLLDRNKRLHEPAPFGERIPASDSYKLFGEFIRNRTSSILQRASLISEPTFLHGVSKHYSESIVARFTCDGTPYVIKYYPQSGAYVSKEAWANRELTRRGVLVAPIVEVREAPPAFVIFENVPGRRLSECSIDEIRGHIGGVCRSVARFREVAVEHYGEIIGEFAPVGNHSNVSGYARSVVAYCRSQLEDHLRTVLRSTSPYSGELFRWANSVLSENETSRIMVESTLSSRPCLCHSDVKLTDIIVQEHRGELEYVLLDFDNVFAFVPEFDLCKFHLSMCERELYLNLESFAEMVAPAYGVSKEGALKGLRSVYPLVLFRLLAWGVRRDHAVLLEQIGRVSRFVLTDEQ